jgi:hypothetical protein
VCIDIYYRGRNILNFYMDSNLASASTYEIVHYRLFNQYGELQYERLMKLDLATESLSLSKKKIQKLKNSIQ